MLEQYPTAISLQQPASGKNPQGPDGLATGAFSGTFMGAVSAPRLVNLEQLHTGDKI